MSTLALLAEFDHEMGGTRRLMERIPPESWAWTPHAKSFTCAGLATHLSRLPHWGRTILGTPQYDITRDGSPQAPAAASLAEALAAFDANVAAIRGQLQSLSEAELSAPWTLLRDGQVLMTLPRVAAFKTFIINHAIHHRGQLTVYLRLLEVPLPGLYGPTADERM
jgi:uncharacterized damage-inducible protein DinB